MSQLNSSDFTKLCALTSQLTQLPSRLEFLLKSLRQAPVKPSSALEKYLSVIEKTFQGQFVRNSTRDRKVLKKLVLDLEKSEDLTERELGQMLLRYTTGTV